MTLQIKKLKQSHYAALKNVVGYGNISVDSADMLSAARDLWPLTTLEVQEGIVRDTPSAVVWPVTQDALAGVMKFADSEGIKVVPYGGGSGVCGGAAGLSSSIAVDMKRMRSLMELNETDMTARAEAGAIGENLERELNSLGYTTGHFPSSMYCSTVGGWLATRSAGQFSTKYGKIEDIVMSLTATLPGGKVISTRCVPRSAAGPDWNQAFIGSEGTLGVISDATLKVRPLPEKQGFLGFSFNDVKSGLEAIRKTLQDGISPAVVRLYDPMDTLFSGFSGGSGKKHKKKPPRGSTKDHYIFEGLERIFPGFSRRWIPRLWINPQRMNALARSQAKLCKLVYVFEGPAGKVDMDVRNARQIALQEGGRDRGEGIARHWYDTRYKVSYNLSPTFDLGLFADTMELAAPWDGFIDLYYSVRKAISRHALVMAHFSHAYPQGCSVYFSFASTARSFDEKMRVYNRIWEDGLDASIAAGGAVSHHHGIGRLKARSLNKEHGQAMKVVAALKKSADPNGILPDFDSWAEERWH